MKKGSTYCAKTVDVNLLVLSLGKGDPEAIASIYRIYFHKLLNYGIQVIGQVHQEVVEDVIQEFFIWLAQNGNKATKIRNFESYMFRAIRRNLQSKLGAAKNSQATAERFLNRTVSTRESETPSPEQIHIRKEEAAYRSTLVQQALQKLPAYQREILYLRYFENKSYPEIAHILSISDQVAYNYTSRAIKRLKQQMTGIALLVLMGISNLFC